MITISKTSIFGRIYHYWEIMTGGNPRWYQENLCHFVRVLIFWAPLNWVFRQKLFNTEVQPWMILSSILFAISLILFRDIRIVVGVLTTIVLLAVGIIKLDTRLEKLYNRSERLQRLGKRLDRAWGWFWGHEFVRYVYPWNLTWVAVHPISFIWARNLFFALLIFEGVIIGAIGTVIAILLLIAGVERIWSRRTKIVLIPRATQVRIHNSLDVAWEYAKAKKRLICPLIQFAD